MKPKSNVWKDGMVLAGILVVSILLTSASSAAAVQYYGKDEATTSESIIVFAPHPDDEALGCARVIHNAVQSSYDIKVVVMTNGDAYKHAFDNWSNPTDMDGDGDVDYVDFGYCRQNETISAMNVFGLSSDNVIFLGYPDGGLDNLWTENWDYDNLYYSPFTYTDYSPYSNSYPSNVPYCGAAVSEDIKNILEQYKPTDVYVTHSADTHPDHWATNLFVTKAVKEFKMNGYEWSEHIRIHNYMIHDGDNWPTPSGYHTDMNLTRPPVLSREPDENVMLNDTAKDLKYNAILAYETQIAVDGDYLVSFVKNNELFWMERFIFIPKDGLLSKENVDLEEAAKTLGVYPVPDVYIFFDLNQDYTYETQLESIDNLDPDIYWACIALWNDGEVTSSWAGGVNVEIWKNNPEDTNSPGLIDSFNPSDFDATTVWVGPPGCSPDSTSSPIYFKYTTDHPDGDSDPDPILRIPFPCGSFIGRSGAHGFEGYLDESLSSGTSPVAAFFHLDFTSPATYYTYYRAWLIDTDDTIYNPWYDRYDSYIARDPDGLHYSKHHSWYDPDASEGGSSTFDFGEYSPYGHDILVDSENEPPTAYIDSITPDPAEQGKDTVKFRGHGTDSDGSVVAYNWRSSKDGFLSDKEDFDKPASDLSLGTHTIYFKVKDDDGAWSTEKTEDLTIKEKPNEPPTAYIDSITPDPAEQGKDTVKFRGHGTDSDGSVVAYNWRSSKDGFLSDKEDFDKPASDLSLGTHTIYFKVKDDDGAWSTEKTEDLTINPETIHDLKIIDIFAPPNVVKGHNCIIDVVVCNEGDSQETDVQVVLKEGSTPISTETVTLASGEEKTLYFEWDTSGSTTGAHTLTATIGPVPGETDTSDNSQDITITIQPFSSCKTIFITNYDEFAEYWPDEVSNLKHELSFFACGLGEKGIVLDVSKDMTVKQAYDNWVVTDPDSANDVANAVDNYLNNKIDNHYSNTEYVIIVGDDRIIPFYRIEDTSCPCCDCYGSCCTEEDYYYCDHEVSDSSSVGSSIRANRILTDNLYGDIKSGLFEFGIITPELAVSRLIESPDQIVNTLDVYKTEGSLVTPNVITMTGWDFMADSITETADVYETELGVSPTRCIGASCTRSCVRGAYLSSRSDITALYVHANHYTYSLYNHATQIYSTDVRDASADMDDIIVYSIGCHAGLNVPLSESQSLDLPEAHIRQGVIGYAGNTGYGIGGDGIILSEELAVKFTENICNGYTVGDALLKAKRGYRGFLPFLMDGNQKKSLL